MLLFPFLTPTVTNIKYKIFSCKLETYPTKPSLIKRITSNIYFYFTFTKTLTSPYTLSAPLLTPVFRQAAPPPQLACLLSSSCDHLLAAGRQQWLGAIQAFLPSCDYFQVSGPSLIPLLARDNHETDFREKPFRSQANPSRVSNTPLLLTQQESLKGCKRECPPRTARCDLYSQPPHCPQVATPRLAPIPNGQPLGLVIPSGQKTNKQIKIQAGRDVLLLQEF